MYCWCKNRFGKLQKLINMDYESKIKVLLNMDIPLQDRMLFNLYLCKNDSGYCRLSSTVNDNKNWSVIANNLNENNCIEYPGHTTYSLIGRISSYGIVVAESIAKNYD